MTMSTIDHDDSLKLGHGDAQAAKAPAKKFALAEIQDRTLWSPGIFAVLSMGLGAYLGRLREIVNPAPNAQVPEDRKMAALDEGTALFEALRCLSCGNCFECDGCYGSCPEQAIAKLGPGKGYRVDAARCTGCGACHDQCPCHAIELRQPEESQ